MSAPSTRPELHARADAIERDVRALRDEVGRKREEVAEKTAELARRPPPPARPSFGAIGGTGVAVVAVACGIAFIVTRAAPAPAAPCPSGVPPWSSAIAQALPQTFYVGGSLASGPESADLHAGDLCRVRAVGRWSPGEPGVLDSVAIACGPNDALGPKRTVLYSASRDVDPAAPREVLESSFSVRSAAGVGLHCTSGWRSPDGSERATATIDADKREARVHVEKKGEPPKEWVIALGRNGP